MKKKGVLIKLGIEEEIISEKCLVRTLLAGCWKNNSIAIILIE